MLFNSYIFIFLFLPLCLVGFYLLQKKQATLAKVWLTCFSLWFYGYFNQRYLLIMICSIIGNYFVHLLIVKAKKSEEEAIKYEKAEEKEQKCKKVETRSRGYEDSEKKGLNYKQNCKSKGVMIAGVAMNILVLFYFKYVDFFIENVNALFGSSYPLKHILLPLGISFFTFQQISFLVDTYRGELSKISFVDYALFVSFFPQLIAGPIVVHEEMIPQFARIGKDGRSKEEKAEIFMKGIYVFVLGLAKKVLIADTFGQAVDLAYGNVAGINGMESLLTVIFYSLQLYFDFSGYCDMAKGIAGMFGMKIANNFNSPYKAAHIVDFWKRWHITLSRFFTKNIYIPLGGNRKGENRMYLNYLIVFFLSGLWHGAGWNFILWGMMHGVLYVATKWWLKHKRKPAVATESELNSENNIGGSGHRRRIPAIKVNACRMLACSLTFIYVSIAWVYFRASSVEQANTLLMNIFTKPWIIPGENFANVFNLGEFWYVLKILKIAALPYAKYYLMFVFTLVSLMITFLGKNIDTLAEEWKPKVTNGFLTAVLFVWCVVSLSGVSTFLYFNF